MLGGLLMACTAFADEILLWDTGSFQNTGTAQYKGLGYVSSLPSTAPLGATTSGGVYGPFELGLFTLTRGSKNENYSDGLFDLDVRFGLPTGISTGWAQLFTATLKGEVQKLSNPHPDEVTIDFGSSSRILSVDNGAYTSSFQFSIFDPVTISLPGDKNSASGVLWGRISAASMTANNPPISIAPVSEPLSTLMLLSTALVGLGLVLRKTRGKVVE
jgi:hypothetical protein